MRKTNFMTIKDQLKQAELMFNHIDKLVNSGKIQEAYELIQNENPPQSWIIELPSIAQKGETFKTIKLELMEAVMRRIFGKCEVNHIEPPIISQDKSGYASATVVVGVKTYILGTTNPIVLSGVATEVVNSIKLLPLATPKASSMAVKNAIKQVGRLLGKYLNNENEELELPIEDKPSIEDQAEAVTQGIITAKTINDLKSWRNLVFSKMGTKEQQELYETKVRQLQSN
ncbi:MAG: hypothetical protein RLZZ196_2615 [Bacteroidota bacterium]